MFCSPVLLFSSCAPSSVVAPDDKGAVNKRREALRLGAMDAKSGLLPDASLEEGEATWNAGAAFSSFGGRGADAMEKTEAGEGWRVRWTTVVRDLVEWTVGAECRDTAEWWTE